MNLIRVRCHAAVAAGSVHKRVVLIYRGDAVPIDGKYAVVYTRDWKILPCDAECHSTVNYNGIAVIGLQDGIAGLRLSVDNVAEILPLLAANANSESVGGSTCEAVMFIPLVR